VAALFYNAGLAFERDSDRLRVTDGAEVTISLNSLDIAGLDRDTIEAAYQAAKAMTVPQSVFFDLVATRLAEGERFAVTTVSVDERVHVLVTAYGQAGALQRIDLDAVIDGALHSRKGASARV
jgi:hypothetical protein